jgi:hypothetical protein
VFKPGSIEGLKIACQLCFVRRARIFHESATSSVATASKNCLRRPGRAL